MLSPSFHVISIGLKGLSQQKFILKTEKNINNKYIYDRVQCTKRRLDW